MKVRKIKRILIVCFIAIIAGCTKSYCTTTRKEVIEVNNPDNPWVNISISDSYERCNDLNSQDSTLGTTELQAHLTTDYDWSAMAILSISQYGGATSNTPGSTTGNNSGIYVDGKFIQTTGIRAEATAETVPSGVKGLFEEDGITTKKYIKQWEYQDAIKFVGFKQGAGGTGNFFGAKHEIRDISTAISIWLGLFNGSVAGQWNGGNGNAWAHVTFRPVIWN